MTTVTTTEQYAVHVCTGCGEAAYSPCVECGEWRCLECRTLGGWCANRSSPAAASSTDRGTFCARSRPEAKRGAKCQCSIVGHVCSGAVRQMQPMVRGSIFGCPLYYCEAFLSSIPVRDGCGWCEVLDTTTAAMFSGAAGRSEESTTATILDHSKLPSITWGAVIAPDGEPRAVLKVPPGLPPGRYVADVSPEPTCRLGHVAPTADDCRAHCGMGAYTCFHSPAGGGANFPLTPPADSLACVGCGHDLKRDPDGRHWDPADGRGYCDACWKRHALEKKSRILETAAELLKALGNPPGLTEANILGIHTFDRPLPVETCREHALPPCPAFCSGCGSTLPENLYTTARMCGLCGPCFTKAHCGPSCPGVRYCTTCGRAFDDFIKHAVENHAPRCERCAVVCVDCGHPAAEGGWPAGHFPPADPRPHCRTCREAHDRDGVHFDVPPAPERDCEDDLPLRRYVPRRSAAEAKARAKKWIARRDAEAEAMRALEPATAGVGARPIIYCEHAPSRELVESTPILLDGNELGASTLGTIAGRVSSHLCWSQSLGAEWDRHATWVAVSALPGSATAPAVMMQDALHRIDRDVPPPDGADAFGGVVVADYEVGLLFNSGRAGLRCRLCGGWIRRAVRL